jgi:hypothetical protein
MPVQRKVRAYITEKLIDFWILWRSKRLSINGRSEPLACLTLTVSSPASIVSMRAGRFPHPAGQPRQQVPHQLGNIARALSV